MGWRAEVWLLDRKYVILAGVAFLIGALMPLAVSAEPYDELGTVAEGVYMVTSDEDRFRISAEDDTGVVVYTETGELVVARQLSGGDDHDFVLQDKQAIVAIFGGPASLEATGEGSVDELETRQDEIDVANAEGGPVDASLTVQMPTALVGITGEVDGTAEDLVVEATTGDELIFRVESDDLSQINRQIAPRVLDADAFDVHVNASHLNGSVKLALVTPVLDATQPLDEAHTSEKDPSEPALAELSHTPIRFTVDDEATATFDIDRGYLLDASLYTENGSQAVHVHRGPDLAQARSHCQDVLECPPGTWEQPEELPPEEITRTLDAGTYLLYVREAAVVGNMTLTDTDGETLFDDVTRLEMTGMNVHKEQAIEFQQPILDIWAETWANGVDQHLEVLVQGTTVYEYRATASSYGGNIDSERTMAPGALASGDVEISMSGIQDPTMQDLSVQLYTIAD